MKENTLTIEIAAPIDVVFEYSTNPKNTHLWFDAIQKEETGEWPIKIGTQYQSTSDGESWSKFTVSDLEMNKVFQLNQQGGTYAVCYTYEVLDSNRTRMTYHEWDTENDLNPPFEQRYLETLKKNIEAKQELQNEFPHVYEWTDAPGTTYPEHAHKGKVSIYVTRGSVIFSGGIDRTVSGGERFDVPVAVPHSAVVGPDGCDYIVGEEIEGDS